MCHLISGNGQFCFRRLNRSHCISVMNENKESEGLSASFQLHSAKDRLVTMALTTVWSHIIANILPNPHAMKIQIYSAYHRLNDVYPH